MRLVEVAHSDQARMAWARELPRCFPYNPRAELDESTICAALDASPELNEEELRSVLEIIDITSAITVPLVTTLIAEALQSVRRAAHEPNESSTRSVDFSRRCR